MSSRKSAQLNETGIAIMTTEMDATQHIELGKGLKMVKPSKIYEMSSALIQSSAL